MKVKQKKNRALLLIVGVVLAAALIVGLWFGVKALNDRSNQTPSAVPTDGEHLSESETPSDSGSEDPTGEAVELTPEMLAAKTKEVYTEDDLQDDDPRYDLTVASCGEYSLTNRDLQIHYGMQYINFLNTYGYYAALYGLDETKALSEQDSYMPGLTWEQLFLMSAMEDYHRVTALLAQAKAEGFTLPEEERASLDEHYVSLEETAQSNGFSSVDELIQSDLGPGVTLETYKKYVEAAVLADCYRKTLEESITWTDEDLREFFDTHPEEFVGVIDAPNVNVRHILFLSDSDEDGTATDEEKAAAKAKAEALLADFRQNPSEERFAQLANENSEDPGSNTNGGLYEEVYPGQMVGAFNDWCFDAARKTGDTDVVETDYGFHVMYFVAQTDTYYWKTVAPDKYMSYMVETRVNEIAESIPITIKYENVVLAPLPLPETE